MADVSRWSRLRSALAQPKRVRGPLRLKLWIDEPADSDTPSHWELREIQPDGRCSRLVAFGAEGEPSYPVLMPATGSAGRMNREGTLRDMERPEFWRHTSRVTVEHFEEAWTHAERRHGSVLTPPWVLEDDTQVSDAD